MNPQALSFSVVASIAVALTACGSDTQNFECVDVANKSSVISFTKKSNSAVYSSAEMRFCKKDGNISTYSDYPIGCSSLLELSKTGGTVLYFDDVVHTLDEKSFVGNVAILATYKCKKVPN